MKKAFVYAALSYLNGYLFIQTISYGFLFAQIVFIGLTFKEFFYGREN